MGIHHILQLRGGILLELLCQLRQLLLGLSMIRKLLLGLVLCRNILPLISGVFLQLGAIGSFFIPHPIKIVKNQLAVLVKGKIFGIQYISEIIYKFRQTHGSIRVFNTVFSPFDQIIQFIYRGHPADMVFLNLACIRGHINELGGVKHIIRLQLFLDHYQLGNIGDRISEKVMIDLRFFKLLAAVHGKDLVYLCPVDGLHRNIGVQQKPRHGNEHAHCQQMLNQLYSQPL